jgi:hypothetical protein
MKIETIALVLGVLVIVGASIVIYQNYYDLMHAQDRILQQFMGFIVSNHQSYFDQRYLDIANWEVNIPGECRTTDTSGLLGAVFQIDNSQDRYYFGHLEANTTSGLFVWDGMLWISNSTVKELIYTITG